VPNCGQALVLSGPNPEWRQFEDDNKMEVLG